MTSICSQTNIESIIIQFPKKTVIQNNNNIFTNKIAINYDVYPATDMFDPNIASSPPNAFVDILKQRMNMYYAIATIPEQKTNTGIRGLTLEDLSLRVNGINNTVGTNNIINKIARNRTLSWEDK